jgi:hypothetical protein
MDPVTNPLNATVMPDGLDLSVKDVSFKKDLFINSTPKLGLAKKDSLGPWSHNVLQPFSQTQYGQSQSEKSNYFSTSTTTASKYIPKRPRICIN